MLFLQLDFQIVETSLKKSYVRVSDGKILFCFLLCFIECCAIKMSQFSLKSLHYPIACSRGQGMEYILWIQTLIYVLPQFL